MSVFGYVCSCRRSHLLIACCKSLSRSRAIQIEDVFVALLYLFCSEQREEAAKEEIGRYLPEEVRGTLKQLLETGSIDDLSCLDELGDVRSVELAKDNLKIWFKINRRIWEGEEVTASTHSTHQSCQY